MFYEQLVKLCKINQVSPTSIIEKLGYSRGSLTNRKNGTTPNGDIIVHFSKFFNVSTDYFLLGKEGNAIIDSNNSTQEKFSVDERMLLNTYREMTDDGKSELLDTMKKIWAEHQLATNSVQPKSKLSNSQNDKSVG